MTGRVRRWQLVVLVLLLWALLSAASYFLLAVPRQNRFDFYHCWVGTRAVLAGENPYSQEVVQRIHEGMFGQWFGGAEEIHQRFAYPAFITWLLLPFWLLPFSLAVSLWCGLQFLILLALPLLLMSLLGWRLPPVLLAAMLLFSVFFFRYPITSYLLGQFTPFTLACLVVAWWGLVRGYPTVATLALLGAAIRPEAALFPLLVLLLAAWRMGRREVVVAWAGLVVCLWLLTRLFVGPWVGGFLGGMGDYAGTSFLRWPPLVFGSAWLAALVTAGVLAWGVWMWLDYRRMPAEGRIPWELSTAILLALIILPQTNAYTLVAALLPAWVVLWAGGERWWSWLSTLVVLALPWGFFFAGGLLPTGLEQLMIPLALGILLTLQWWARRGGAR
ncbi:MAG: hypothetical protein AB8I69_19825 [Anaerolineae bacterium]